MRGFKYKGIEMESLCDRIKARLLLKIKASIGRKGLVRSEEEVQEVLDAIMNDMADFLVEKFDDFWGV